MGQNYVLVLSSLSVVVFVVALTFDVCSLKL